MTVVLFAALFAFVTRFPAPPAQSVNQFQASVVLNSTGKGISGVRILQEGGPLVPEADHIFLKSSRSATNWQFSLTTGIPVSWGTGNGTTGWNVGQYWTTTFSPAIKLPANITVYVLSSSALLYEGIAPGGSANVPPLLTSTYTVPTLPTVGTAFQIVALVSGNTTGLTLNISLSEIPGLPTTVQAMHPYGTGEWVYNASATTTTAGTYRAFIQGVNTTGGTISGSAAVTLASSGSGSSLISVVVGVSPQQPPVPQNTTLTPTFFLSATVNYTGTVANVPVAVNFTLSQSPGGGKVTTSTTTLAGQTGLKVTGPGTVVVYSQTGFGKWLLNATDKIVAAVHLEGVGYVNATTSIQTLFLLPGPILSGVAAGIRPLTTGIANTSTLSSGTPESTWSHSCTSSTCPFLYIQIYDNFTAPLGGPKQLWFNGTVWATGSGGSCTSSSCNTSYTISNSSANTRLKPGSFDTVNVVSPGSTTTRMTAASWWASGIKITFTTWLEVNWGGTAVDYVYFVYTSAALS